MRSLYLVALATSILLMISACGTPQIVIDQRSEIDSLQVAYGSLQDTLTFYESIESGSYYRDLRMRDMRINELEYMLSVEDDGRELLVSELVDDLFQPASAVLLESGKIRLDTLAIGLLDIPVEDIIRIEAHADNVMPGLSLREKYPSNWELSAARAAAVARYLIDNHEMVPSRLEVITFGDSRPAFDNGTAKGRKLNRRIEIFVPSVAQDVDNSE